MSDLLTPPSKLIYEQGQFVTLARLSVVVPVGPGDCAWKKLLESFTRFPDDTEVLLVASEVEPKEFANFIYQLNIPCKTQWISADRGRAQQMNAGAQLAQREYLWFLHADSQLSSDVLEALGRALHEEPGAVHYFDLKFQTDGPPATKLNAWGVWLRSHWLKLPFGDQGFCMSRAIFDRLCGFPENAPYGEDHLLVWKAHRLRIPLRAVAATLLTSARKYRSQGWLQTTAIHTWRTWKQAFPELVALLWSRFR
ncbi:glycosyltransferase [Bythopirellula polymerisocia]|uniref:Glycosyl transferase family 2 n=1 Tax=Bythopirellula polymerisocia TaxID=2528003 RepID=A0A5C6CS55_9BACT|nr:glycosyltransferase [Bythopirellula polymerisocia]TWU27380.1 Glycosyl transferase family 2 [Bythopirellula polymerisocia]